MRTRRRVCNYSMRKIGEEKAKEILAAIFKNKEFILCEYAADTDTLIIYDEKMGVKQEIHGYLASLDQDARIHPKDRGKIRGLCLGREEGRAEIRLNGTRGMGRLLVQTLKLEASDKRERIPLIVRDITREKQREKLLEEQAARDSLTSVYNFSFGRKLINDYLQSKDPYATCGMMVMDIDYFKYVNDTFGHLFGDYVLSELARLLKDFFEEKDVVMRFGGDEFVVFLKDISHSALVKKGMQFVEAVRGLKFEEKDYSMTCSVGICYLSENESGYTFDQLFGNADWALYRAKENGKDQYAFCDNLRRFELTKKDLPANGSIDARYLRNDVISTAFEIFEKRNSFSSAIEQLMEIIGYRFRLDRITIIRTDIQEKNTGRQYQWTSDYAPEVLKEKAEFTKEDFLTLFQSYDEYQTTVLQWNNMSMYSPQGAALLMQGGAKTVLYAAMYCEGKYTGAISYVTCREKRYWSRQNRKELGEVTKIISAHLARRQAVNERGEERLYWSDYDSLTGLISFSRFRVELERLVIGSYAASDYLLYMDFAGFKYFNQKYGYSRGDQLLKEFCGYCTEKLGDEEGVYFTRIVSDQFLLLLPGKERKDIVKEAEKICQGFADVQAERLPGFRPRVRIGIYRIEDDCISASFAIDAANYARKQISEKWGDARISVCLFDEALARKQRLENEIINEIEEAIREQRFRIFLQPKISLKDGSVTGAEALARWQTRDGRLILPDQFISLCESTGQIKELDFYVFEQTVQFLAKNQKLGRKQIPISVNASILHASDDRTAEKYLAILQKYQVEAKYTEIELTETATVKEYEEAKRLFRELHAIGIRTSIDDFGAGYSVLNTIIDIPADTMKLDRVFIQNCKSSPKGIYFLQKIIQMIRGLGYHVVCEGVESEEQKTILKEAGCEEAQGFLFSRPMTIEEYEAFVYPEENRKD